MLMEKIFKKLQHVKFSKKNSSLFNEFVCNLGFFWHEGANSTSAKKAQITQERVEFNVFLFDEPPKAPNR
jgi:hypothetical protein